MALTGKKRKSPEDRAPGNLMKSKCQAPNFLEKINLSSTKKGGCILENWPLISRVRVFKVFSQVQYHFHHIGWAFLSVNIIKEVNFTTFDQVVLCV